MEVSIGVPVKCGGRSIRGKTPACRVIVQNLILGPSSADGGRDGVGEDLVAIVDVDLASGKM